MEFQGKTVEEAIELGLKELGIARDDAEITVVDQGKKKLFGSVPARVEIVPAVKLTDGERAVKFLEGLFPFIATDAKPVLVSEDEKIVIQLEGETKELIGRRGEIIDAVQTLAGAVANTGRAEYKRVVVDCGNYRESREETLKRVANKLAAKAVRTGKRVRLEPMNPYERRIIHSALVDNEEVTTRSEGREPNRYVVITPKNLRRFENRGPRGDGQPGRKNDRGPRGDRGERGNRTERTDRGERNARGGRGGEKKPFKPRDPSDTRETSGTSISRSGTPAYKKGGFTGFFGTYLGKAEEENPTPKTESGDTMPETEGTALHSDDE